MKDNKHTLSSGSDQYDSANRNTKFDVNLLYVPSLYKVIIDFANNYQVDLRNTEFGELIGFKKKLVTDTEYGTSLPNITNSVDELNINANIVSGSRVNGRKTNTIAVIPLNNLSRSYPFSYEPKRIYFNRISDNVSDITFSITDSINRPVDLNGIDWSMRLVLRVVPKK